MFGQKLHSFSEYFTDRLFLSAFFGAFAIFLSGTVLNFYAGLYATNRASNYVEDIILSNVPVVDVDQLFVIGTFFIVLMVLVIILIRPHWIPFVGASLGLFYAIRAVFISVTHLGPFPDRVEVLDWGTIVAKFIGGADFFFSGHTGGPFLLALVFWHVRPLRYIFLSWSLFFAATVLLGHVHYTVDVLSAYFVTFTVFQISEHLFPEYRLLFHNGLPGLRTKDKPVR